MTAASTVTASVSAGIVVGSAGFWVFVLGVTLGVAGLAALLIALFRKAPARIVPDAPRNSDRQPAVGRPDSGS